jgi:hypothetical protein
MTILEADYTTPFKVEFCNDVNADICGNSKCFSDLASAEDYARSQADRFSAVWLSELGTYRSKTGKRTDWMYFWWSKQVALSDELPIGRGTGYPFDYPKQWVSYSPYAS